MSLFQVTGTRRPGTFLHAMGHLQRNMGQKTLQKVFKAGWRSIKSGMEKDYKNIPVPVKRGRYSPLHVNVTKYRRKRGDLKRSVKYFQSKRVPKHGMPRAYMRISNYPYNFLIHGTKQRQIKTGKRRGQNVGRIPDRMIEQPFYSVKAPSRINSVLRIIHNSPALRRPLG